MVPTNSQAFVISGSNLENFKRCLSKVDKHSKMIKGLLEEEMRRIEAALSSDSDEEQELHAI